MIQKELEAALYSAVREAQKRRHEYLTLEHVLYVLCFDDTTAKILRHCGATVEELKEDLDRFLSEDLDRLPGEELIEPMQTVAFQRVMQRAIFHVRSSGKKEVDGGNVLVAIFGEPDSHAVFFLKRQGVNRLDVVSYISHGISKLVDEDDEGEDDDEDLFSGGSPSSGPGGGWDEGGGFGEDEEDEGDKLMNPLEAFCTNLVERATNGEIDPLIGRRHEIERTVQILCRRRKNNPILVGDPGVGKTAIAEGLARLISEGDVPRPLRDAVVYSLDLGGLLAGTKFRGQFEQRLKAVIKALQQEDNAVLFIDEIHNIVGAGATSGGTMDASNILKPALASGSLRCIGSTTHEEFKRSFERDKALARRFQKIDILEPSLEETRQILKGLKKYYEEFHDVEYTDEAIDQAAELAHKYIRERANPDKAIDVIDEAGARFRVFQAEAGHEPVLDAEDIQEVVAKIARIPDINVTKDERTQLRTLEETLKDNVYGQDLAIEAVVSAVKMSRAGLTRPDKPVGSFLFAGPTGVGKTEVARQLAMGLGVDFVRFDMSEYMERHAVSRLIGAPPGYVGFDQGGQLTEAIRKSPHCVLLLDEIEKAHPDIFNILLQVMDNARLTDNSGREADFRNVILIMTSNAGAFDMERASVGFNQGIDLSKGIKAIEKMFPPEFRNRLDATITFQALPMEIVMLVVDKFVEEMELQLADRHVKFALDDDTRRWLASEGYDEKLGARPLGRVLQEQIKRPLAEEILFGELVDGGLVRVSVNDDGDGLAFAFEALPEEDEDDDEGDEAAGEESQEREPELV